MLCTIKALIDIPFCIMTYYQQSSFTLSIAGVYLQLLLAKGWTSPAILILKTVVDPSVSSLSVAMFLLLTNIVNTIASNVMGVLTKGIDPTYDPHQYGLLVSIGTIVPCAISIPFFLISGYKMKKIKEELEESMTREQIAKENDFMKQFTKLATILDGEYSNIHIDILKNKNKNSFRRMITHQHHHRLKSVNFISVIEQQRVPAATSYDRGNRKKVGSINA